MLAQLLPAQALLLVGLHAQELFLIVPFVKRARLVETLVTLQADEIGVENFGEHLGDFGLAGAGGTFYEQRLFERKRQEDRGLDALVGDIAGAREAVGDLFVGDVHALQRAVELWGAAALEENPRAMLEAVALVARSGAQLFGVGRELDAQALEVNAGARGLHVVEADHRLRHQVDRRLAAAALEAQMERRGNLIEGDDERLQVGVVAGRARGRLEHLGRVEIRAAIECGDGVVERCRLGIVTHGNLDSYNCSFSSTARYSASPSAWALRAP